MARTRAWHRSSSKASRDRHPAGAYRRRTGSTPTCPRGTREGGQARRGPSSKAPVFVDAADELSSLLVARKGDGLAVERLDVMRHWYDREPRAVAHDGIRAAPFRVLQH